MVTFLDESRSHVVYGVSSSQQHKIMITQELERFINKISQADSFDRLNYCYKVMETSIKSGKQLIKNDNKEMP
jgi:hypothetical protein